MAVAVVTFVGAGRQVDAESTTGWNAGNLDNDIYVQGAGSVGAKTSNTTSDFYDDNALNLDFSSGGANEGQHIFAWFNTLTPVSLHGIIAMENAATSAVGYWNVGPPTGYGGGWISYVVDPADNSLFTVITAGTPTWTGTGNPAQLHNVDGFGGRHTTSTSIMGNFNNALVDAISVGYGYRITRGDAGSAEAKFSDIITYERNSSNRYGALRSDAGVLVMLSQIVIGDTTANSHEFTDSNFTVVWADAPVATTFYQITAEEGTGTTTIILDNGVFKAESSAQSGKPLIDFTGITSATLNNVGVVGGRAINLDGNITWNDSVWQDTGQIDLGGQPTLDGITVLDPTDDGAMLINATNELTNVSNIIFDGAGVGGTSVDAAIEVDITGAGPFTLNFDNITFQNRIAGSVDVHILANSNADYTINVLNGGSTPTYTNDGTGTVSVENPKTTLINIRDENGDPKSGVRVYLEAADGTGDLPYQESVTISRTTTTATVTHTGHGLKTNEYVKLDGITDKVEDNAGAHQITVTDANTYTYTTTDSGSTSYTGTITATGAIIYGTTDASGNISSQRTWTLSQPVTGQAKSPSTNPYYQTISLADTVSNTDGLTINRRLIPDE